LWTHVQLLIKVKDLDTYMKTWTAAVYSSKCCTDH